MNVSFSDNLMKNLLQNNCYYPQTNTSKPDLVATCIVLLNFFVLLSVLLMKKPRKYFIYKAI
jgi:hypothetical protein